MKADSREWAFVHLVVIKTIQSTLERSVGTEQVRSC